MSRPGYLRVRLHFFLFLLGEFRLPILVFSLLVLVGGAVLQHHSSDEKPLTYVHACHEVFMLIFMEFTFDNFPEEWYIQAMLFLTPIIGLGAVADSVVRLAYLVFARKSQLPEYHRINAKLHRNHVIVVGQGKVGYRITRELLERRVGVVVIESDQHSPLLQDVLDRGAPWIQGDGRLSKILELANVRQAHTLILATDDDVSNLDGALTARQINPNIRIVTRMFDDTFAVKFAGALGMPVFSTARIGAAHAVAKLMGHRVFDEIHIHEDILQILDLNIPACANVDPTTATSHAPVVSEPTAGNPGSWNATYPDAQIWTVARLARHYKATIILHRDSQGRITLLPGPETQLDPGDTILILTPKSAVPRLLDHLEPPNQTNPRPRPTRTTINRDQNNGPAPPLDFAHLEGHIVVVGAGRVGYRAVEELRQRRLPVLVIDPKPHSLLIDEIREWGVPILAGDARRLRVLEQAGVARAQAIFLATTNDMVNIDAALSSLELNPNLQVVVRMFDDTLAEKLETAFGMPTVSAAKSSVPVFLAAALPRAFAHPIQFDGCTVWIWSQCLEPSDPLVGLTASDLERRGLRIAYVQRDRTRHHPPDPRLTLLPGDHILAAGPKESLPLPRSNQDRLGILGLNSNPRWKLARTINLGPNPGQPAVSIEPPTNQTKPPNPTLTPS